MHPSTAETLAKYLLDSARDTKDFKHSFIATYDLPPTVMNQVHHLRSVLQALIARDETLELSERRAEFGRVEFMDFERQRFLLKSARAFAIEQQMEAAEQLALFDSTITADVHVIVFDFDTDELRLHVAPALEIGRKKEVRVVGTLELCGQWPIDPIHFDDTAPFDQDLRDSFGEIGREDEEGGFGL